MSSRAYWVILACALLAYGASLGGDFVFDDNHSVRDNPYLHSLANIPSFFVDVDMFSSIECRLYRPVLLSSYALNVAMAGMQPWIFKLTNLLLHAGSAMLLFKLARSFRLGLQPALFVAVLFVVHPLASEAVNTISARSNLLVVFGLLAGMCFHQAAIAGNRWAVFGTLAAGFVACGSKEPGMILPVLLVVLEGLHFRANGMGHRAWQSACMRLLPSVALVFGYLLLRHHVLQLHTFVVGSWEGNGDAYMGYSRGMVTQVCTMALLLPRMLLHVFLPYQLSMDPVVPFTDDWTSVPVICGMLLIVLLVGLGLSSPKKRPLLFLGTCLACGCAAPWVIKPLNAPYLEHRLHGVLAGLALVAGSLMSELRWQSLRQYGCRYAVLGVALVMAFLSMQRSLEFRSEKQLWTLEHHRNPESIRAAAGLSVCYMLEGQWSQARPLLEGIIKQYPLHVEARSNLARTELKLATLGDPHVALRQARYLVNRFPDNPFHRLLLSEVLTAVGVRDQDPVSFREAEVQALYCLELDEPKGLVYRTAAQARRQSGDLQGALDLLDQSIARGLDHSSVQLDRVRVLAQMDRQPQARDALLRILRDNPFDQAAIYELQQLQAAAAAPQ